MVYAVRVGRQTGKFKTWAECEKQVKGVSNAEFKKFYTDAEADKYLGCVTVSSLGMQGNKRGTLTKVSSSTDVRFEKGVYADTSVIMSETSLTDNQAVAYIGGSYSSGTTEYGFGCILRTSTGSLSFYGSDDTPSFSEYASISGNIFGVLCAIRQARRLGKNQLLIVHNYEGVCRWATGEWRVKSPISQLYKEFIDISAEDMHIEFKILKGKAVSSSSCLKDAMKLSRQAVEQKKRFMPKSYFLGYDVNDNLANRLSANEVENIKRVSFV